MFCIPGVPGAFVSGEGEGVPIETVDVAKDSAKVGASNFGFFFGGFAVSEFAREAERGLGDGCAGGVGLAVAAAGEELGSVPSSICRFVRCMKGDRRL